jgi:transcriptional regulator with XRE-family HTH domain
VAEIALHFLRDTLEVLMPKPSKIAVVSYRDIGVRIRTLRQQRDMTQTGLADLLGTKQTAISEVERGNRGLTVQQLVKVARALKTSPNEILGEGRDGTPKPRSARILRRLHRIEHLPEVQQDALLQMIDGAIKANRR